MGQHYIDEVDGVFFTDRTAATEQEFRSRIARFEAAPTPPEIVEEAVLEEVARAMYEAHMDPEEFWTVKWEHAYGMAEIYRRLAAAAVAAIRAAQDGGAEEAVRRVEALAESWRYKGEFGWGAWQEGQGPDLEGTVLDQAAADIRAALAPVPVEHVCGDGCMEHVCDSGCRA